MENKIRETTDKLQKGLITKNDADKILLGLFDVTNCLSKKTYKKQNELFLKNKEFELNKDDKNGRHTIPLFYYSLGTNAFNKWLSKNYW